MVGAPLRFVADMNISPLTVAALAADGVDILRVSSLLPVNASEENILGLARQQGRTVITQDMDFSALLALGGHDQPSPVTLRFLNTDPDVVTQRLRQVLPPHRGRSAARLRRHRRGPHRTRASITHSVDGPSKLLRAARCSTLPLRRVSFPGKGTAHLQLSPFRRPAPRAAPPLDTDACTAGDGVPPSPKSPQHFREGDRSLFNRRGRRGSQRKTKEESRLE